MCGRDRERESVRETERERERGRKREKENEREREREREGERERERETESLIFILFFKISHISDFFLSTVIFFFIFYIFDFSCLAFFIISNFKALKLDTLLLLRQTLESHIPQALQPFLSRLLPLIVSCVNEDWFKIIAESLRTLGAVILVARPQLNDNNDNSKSNSKSNSNSNNNITELGNNGNEEYNFRPLVLPIYNSVLTRLEALDIDQEIKDCSIATVGRLFAYFGDELKQQLPIVLNLLKKKLENENTRTQTLKSISILANSKLNLDLSSVLLESTSELSLFLRQKSRSLKQITLFTLDSLINSKSVILRDGDINTILLETSSLINDNDLHLTYLALNLTLSILKSNYDSIIIVKNYIYPKMIELASSPLLQGSD